jgi:phosphoribosylaminoimidazole carboxylase (NCAIR synthetase)
LSRYSSEKLADLGGCDVVTAEIEHFNAKAFTTCTWLVPSYVTFDTISNKANQKKFLASNNIPVVDHVLWNCQEPWTCTKTGRYVVKCTTGGYDGRGVFFIDNPTPDTMLCNANGLTLFQLGNQLKHSTVREFNNFS